MKSKETLIATVPGIVMLVLFYSLAAHMYLRLGGWPDSIGDTGFPLALRVHSITTGYCFNMLMLSFLFLPIPILTCLFVQRWRHLVAYLAMYAGTVLFSFIVTQIVAPAGFLHWWRD